MHLASLDRITQPVNNPIDIFLINPAIIFYPVFFFIKYLWISKTLLASVGLKSTEKNFTAPLNSVSFHIINCKIFRNIT